MKKWDKFVKRTYGSYMSQAYDRLSSTVETEDAVQDTYLILLSKYKTRSIKELDMIGAGILKYKCMQKTQSIIITSCEYKNHRNINAPTVFPIGTFPRSMEPSYEYDISEYDLNTILSSIKGVLSERQWTIMWLVGQGYPHKEIAAKMGIPKGTVRSAVFYSRAQIKKLYPDYF